MPDFFGRTHGLAHEFPLRPDFMVQLVLPVNLTTKEARRLAAFLLTLADDDDQTIVTNPSTADERVQSID
jgi:hypothetical protein